jgi:hypothetical protein
MPARKVSRRKRTGEEEEGGGRERTDTLGEEEKRVKKSDTNTHLDRMKRARRGGCAVRAVAAVMQQNRGRALSTRAAWWRRGEGEGI